MTVCCLRPSWRVGDPPRTSTALFSFCHLSVIDFSPISWGLLDFISISSCCVGLETQCSKLWWWWAHNLLWVSWIFALLCCSAFENYCFIYVVQFYNYLSKSCPCYFIKTEFLNIRLHDWWSTYKYELYTYEDYLEHCFCYPALTEIGLVCAVLKYLLLYEGHWSSSCPLFLHNYTVLSHKKVEFLLHVVKHGWLITLVSVQSST